MFLCGPNVNLIQLCASKICRGVQGRTSVWGIKQQNPLKLKHNVGRKFVIVRDISDGIPELLESNGSSSVLTLKTIDAFFKFSPFAASYRCLNAGACLANCMADAAFLIFQTPEEVPQRRTSHTDQFVPATVLAVKVQ